MSYQAYNYYQRIGPSKQKTAAFTVPPRNFLSARATQTHCGLKASVF